MAKRRQLMIIAALLITLAAVWSICGSRSKSTPEPNWLLIKWYAGSIAPDENVIARVYVARQFSDDRTMDTDTFLQNKIEVLHDGSQSVFLWPDDKSYAAGWAELIDLDHDGSKEFMIGGDRGTRIVSYHRGNFRFRPKLDDILSTGYDMGPVDLNSDGRYEFIVGEPIETFPQQSGASVPHIKQWNSESGFMDVSGEFRNYYEQRLIPDVQSKLSGEKDKGVKAAYQQALRDMADLARPKK